VSRDSVNPSSVSPDRLDHAREWVRPAPPVPRPVCDSTKSNVAAWVNEVSVKQLAEWAMVTEGYARMIKSGRSHPSATVEKLVKLHLAGRVVPESWVAAGFSFGGFRGAEALCGPDGAHASPGEVLAIPFLHASISAHQADQRRFRADAEYAADLRHAYQRLRAAFMQIGAALSDADRLLVAGHVQQTVDTGESVTRNGQENSPPGVK